MAIDAFFPLRSADMLKFKTAETWRRRIFYGNRLDVWAREAAAGRQKRQKVADGCLVGWVVEVRLVGRGGVKERSASLSRFTDGVDRRGGNVQGQAAFGQIPPLPPEPRSPFGTQGKVLVSEVTECV